MTTIRTKAAQLGIALTSMLGLVIGLAILNGNAFASPAPLSISFPASFPASIMPPNKIASDQALRQEVRHPQARNTAPGVCGTWNIVPSPNAPPPSFGNILHAIGVVSANDIWAVGGYINNGAAQTLIEHWNGTAWSIVPSPNAAYDNYLWGVAALSANDVWAVGFSEIHGGATQTLIEHWNGTAWSIVPSPNPDPGYDSFLFGITVVSSSDIWVVGDYLNVGVGYETLTMHWNGTTWSIVPSPNSGSNGSYLQGVAKVSSGDIWAVGYYDMGGGTYQTFTEHWNGTAWSIVSSPNNGVGSNSLHSVAAVSTNDVWAVGEYYNVGIGIETLTEHWNGTAWSIVSSPNATSSHSDLNGVAAVSTNDVWAVGAYDDGGGTLTEHWDGAAWTIVPSPNSGVGGNDLNGVAIVSATDVWTAGGGGNTLIERYTGSCGSPSPTLTTGTTTPLPTNTPANTATRTPTQVSSSTNTPTSVPTQTPGGPTTTPVPPSNTPANTSTATSTTTPTATSTPCSVQFERVPSANSGSSDNRLRAMAVVSANDVWAVGSYYDGSASQTLVEQWNGTAWNIVPSPNVGSVGSGLNGVAAVSANDVWAVGTYGMDGGTYQTLIEHWNGTVWSIVPSPNVGSYNYLSGVTAVSANDVWTVGDYRTGSTYQTLTEHWNGTAWAIVPSPSPGSYFSYLNGVAAVSAANIWAVGIYRNGTFGANQTLIEHWNGTAWAIVPSPSPGTYNNVLFAVAFASANDGWAIGFYDSGAPTGSQTLTEHWNGTVWSIVPSPNLAGDDRLNGIAVVSANDVWAVGQSYSSGQYHVLTEHWNGNVWNVVPSIVQSTSAVLLDVAVASASDAWAVGYAGNGVVDRTLIERYNPCASSPTPTVTGTPPTNTPSPIATNPTVCPIQFTDVPAGSTFYEFIRCLACRGIINGYPDGTFKPNNLVTRGQLSKIVSNAASFSDPQTDRMFQDVPVGSTFFDFIGRLASRGYIGGYSCGGVGEPCVPPANLPYFRPNNNATRGQIAKIDSNAAGFVDPPTGQTFEDVPPGSTFYTYTQRLTSRSIMQGYPCGGGGEPCVPPNNRPYFRPNNNATRGQTTKIVANTFFPNCQTPHSIEANIRPAPALSRQSVTAPLSPPLIRYVSERVPAQGPSIERAAERPPLPLLPTRVVDAVPPLRPSAPFSNSWQLLATLPGAVVKDVSFPTALIGYAAAELGQVWKTTDGGAHWNPVMNLGFPYYWYGVYAMDANTVVVSGFINNNWNGVLRWSTDGGATWAPDQVLTDHGWSYRVRFADDALHGLVVDGVDLQAPNRVHYTTNGGHTGADWTPVVPDPSPQGGWFGNQFSLLSNLKARLAGITYCTSPDGGATWGCGPSIDPVFDGPVFFATDQAGWVGGGSISPTVEGWLHRTTDGGTTWTGRVLSSPWPIREIRFLDTQIGWAAGGDLYSGVGGIYFSSDGGQTWGQDVQTGAEMDACDTQPVGGGGGQQVWCIGYTQSGGFASKVYGLLYGGPAVTGTPTVVITQTATLTPTPTTSPTTPPIVSQTATATPTLTLTAVNTPTATWTATQPAATTSTATRTAVPPTPCTIQFTDVPQGSTFYPYVRCLACLGIINGYSDGTFRPNNNVTRGQLSKIVSNSAGFSDPQTVQMFQDVPVGSTFHIYIGRLASRGYISGYPCGGAGEPCVQPGNLPYFRANNNATRGQIAKIDGNAAGFVDPPAGQTFEDVPPGSTFYTYTQRLTSRSIMQGYPCGGAGEPCVHPDDRPYFRPFNNATRGQTSKIVANTFFPDCQTPARK